MEERLTKLWYRDDSGPSLLQPLSWLYGGVVHLRRSAFEHGLLSTHRVGKPVIVVGNLTVGGVVSQVVAGGAGGAILTALVGAIKNKAAA